jgi:hypothetical protein
MAKGKSSSGKNYVSKGENKNVNSKLLNSIRAERTGADNMREVRGESDGRRGIRLL